MILLAVETSGPMGSIALRREGRCVEERLLPEVGRRHAQSLVSEAKRFVETHGLTFSELDGIAVGVGPGSFTGLRVGVTFAKTVAYAASIPLTAVDTFLAIATGTPGEGDVCVVADAQRRGVMLGRYRRNTDGRHIRDGEIEIIPLEQVAERIPPGSLLTGDVSDRLLPYLPAGTRLAPRPHRRPRAAIVASVGEERLKRGEADDAWSLEPLYIRKSGAEEKREATI